VGATGVQGAATGDRFVDLAGRTKKIAWSLSYAGLLLYVYIITTFHIQIAEIAIAIGLLGLVMQREPFRFPRILVLFGALLLWSALGLATTRWPDLVQTELSVMAKLGVIILLATNALRTRSQIRFFVIFWLACYALFPVRGTFFNYFIGGYTQFGRALWNGTYANPNDLAAMTLLMLGLTAGVLVTEKRGLFRHASLIGVVLLTLLIFMTQSRAGIVGLAAFGLCAFVGTRRRGQMMLLVAVAGIVVATLAPATVWQRLGGLRQATSVERLGDVDPEGSAAQRYRIWQNAWEIIGDHPVSGVGLGAYGAANYQYSPRLGRVDTHSTYFNVLAELGVPGLAIFLTLVFGTMLSAERVRRICRMHLPGASRQLFFLEIAILSYMISGIWGSYARLNFLYLSLVLLYALTKACENDLLAFTRPQVPQRHPMLRT
jgi:O-antigen ligase